MTDEPTMRWDELLLAEAAAEMQYPATPDLVEGVAARLARPGRAPARGAWGGQLALRAATAALVVALVATLVLVLSRDVREAVADFLGLAVEGERIEILPTPRPGETPTPLPTPRPLDAIATPTSLEAAATRLRFAPALIPGAAPPTGVYVIDYLDIPVLVLQYAQFDLWETNGAIFEKGVFAKGVQVIEQVAVKGRPAYWISGGSHIVRVVDSSGREVAGSERTVTRNTLVWRSASFNYRLETDLSEAEALRIAVTLP